MGGMETRDDSAVVWRLGSQSTSIRLPDIGGGVLKIDVMLEITVDPNGQPREHSEDNPTPNIIVLQATIFNDRLASDETIEVFAVWISGLLRENMEVTTFENSGKIKTINWSTASGNRKQWQRLMQPRNPTWVYIDDCYWLTESWGDVVGLEEFGWFLGKPHNQLVPGFFSPSSQMPSFR